MTVAVFVDVENLTRGLGKKKFSHVDIDATILHACERLRLEHDAISHYAVYGPWWRNDPQLAAVKATVRDPSAKFVETGYLAGKSILDTHLVVDAMRHASRRRADTYLIASGDADFVPLVRELKSYRSKVFGLGRSGETNTKTADTYQGFIWLTEKLMDQLVEVETATDEIGRLRQWALGILNTGVGLHPSYVRSELLKTIEVHVGGDPMDHIATVLDTRRFKTVIEKLFPDCEFRYSDDGNAVERGSSTEPDEGLPLFRGGRPFGTDPRTVDPALEYVDEEPEAWDYERWSILTLPLVDG